ncbi:MAG: chromosome segregation ATPase [Promethearchaeota archaeon CR_4]|nr:MAG: chromosome segregation ATPase [Candidatus Lokiarchaeota archaeon CR_4]
MQRSSATILAKNEEIQYVENQLEKVRDEQRKVELNLLNVSTELADKQISKEYLFKDAEELNKSIEQHKVDENALEQKIQNRRNDLNQLNQLGAKNREELQRLVNILREKVENLSSLEGQIENKKNEMTNLEQAIKTLQAETLQREKQKDAFEAVMTKNEALLQEKNHLISDLELRITDRKAEIDGLNAQVTNFQSVLKLKEDSLTNLNALTGKLSEEQTVLREKVDALNQEITEKQQDRAELTSGNADIEKKIGESRKLFQQLKISLENEEKELREKESRIHRIEVMSFMYRTSKLFGGIFIFMGLLFLVLGFGFGFDVLNASQLNNDLVIFFVVLAAVFFLISGIFQLEKV